MNSLKTIVENEGLELLGVVPAEPDLKTFESFNEWRKQGLQGSLSYLDNNVDCRTNLNLLLENVKSVIVLGLNCYSDEEDSSNSHIARFARIDDYHKLIKTKGKKIIKWLHASYKDQAKAKSRVIVDSAPFFERAFALKTGSGIIGYNTTFIHKKLGSFILLGEILTTLKLDPLFSEPQQMNARCESCKKCIKACPTGALLKPYILDTRKCISFWTTDKPKIIPEEIKQHMNKYTVGCDICQDVCPYNIIYQSHKEG